MGMVLAPYRSSSLLRKRWLSCQSTGLRFVLLPPISSGHAAMVDVMGVWEAFVVCFGVCVAWLWVFDWHFKPRMPHNQQMREEERSKKKQRSPVRRKTKQPPFVYAEGS